MKIYGKILLIFLLLGYAELVYTSDNENTKNNLAILENAFLRSSVEIIEKNIPKASGLWINVEEDTELGKWIRQSLIDSCLIRNYKVYESSGESNNYYKITISDPRSRIEYRSLGHRFLFFKKDYRRSVQHQFNFSVVNPESLIIYSRQFQGNYADTLSGKMIAEVENPQFSFLQGRKLNSPGIKRLAEPVLITGATLSVIYLFYTLRSGK